MAVLVPQWILVFCYLDSFVIGAPKEVRIMFIINFVKLLFPGVCSCICFLCDC